MDYTVIPEKIYKERDDLTTPLRKGEKVRVKDVKNCTTYFAYHQLGIRPYAWQHLLFKKAIFNNKHILVTSPRQVGKSFSVAVMALHYVLYNLYPIKSKGNRTIIGIVSKSDAQSKKIISDIRSLMDLGDFHVEKKYGVKQWFTSHLSTKAADTVSKTHLTFRKIIRKGTKEFVPEGDIIGEIIAIPATESARGYTFSRLFMDEAAFFENDDFFNTIAEPTLRHTKGTAIVTTTPNGQRGWFYKVFDPFDEQYEKEDNPYERIWLHYNHIEDEDERANVLIKKKELEAIGMGKKFEQEYEAKFTVDDISFFDAEKVDAMFDDSMAMLESYDKPTDMGVDIGFKDSRTVITISTKEENIIKRLYHYRYPAKSDLSLADDIEALIPRFNVKRVIVDDCLVAGTKVLMSDYTRKNIEDIKLGDYVKSYDFEKGEYVDKEVTSLIEKSEDKVYEVSLRNNTSVKCSGSHKWFVLDRRTGKIKVKTTLELNPEFDRIPIALNIPTGNNKPISKEEAYLLGMYIAEGHKRPTEKSFFISQLRGDMKKKIEEKLHKTHWIWQKNTKGFYLSDIGKTAQAIFNKVNKYAPNKNIPEEVFGWDKELLEALYEGLIDGDGHIQKEYISKTNGKKNSKRYIYYTSSKQLFEDFKLLSLLLNKPVGVTSRINSGFGSKRIQYEISHNVNSHMNEGYVGIKSIEEAGYEKTYDLEVEETHSFILPENLVITHNCPAAGQLIQDLEKRGINYKLFNFRKLKTRNYVMFRSKMYQGLIKSYPDTLLSQEMKGLIEFEGVMNTRIEKPKIGSDDVIDSLLMSVTYYIEDERKFKIYDMDEVE